jgi:hypothetical protein
LRLNRLDAGRAASTQENPPDKVRVLAAAGGGGRG